MTPLAYISLSTTSTITFSTGPSFVFTLPSGTNLGSGSLYLGIYDPTSGNGWTTAAGPATVSGTSVTFSPIAGPITFKVGVAYDFALFSTSQVLVISTPSPTPTTSPTATPTTNPEAYTCPSSTTVSSVAAAGRVSSSDTMRHSARQIHGSLPSSSTTMLAVTYSRGTALSQSAQIADRESVAGARYMQQLDFPHLNKLMHVVSVPTANVAATEATLRAQAGVESVGITGGRRFATKVTTPYYPSDPYFNGFTTTIPPTTGATAPPETYHVGTYSESASVPGQWDMHAIGLEHAFGYSQSTTVSGSTVSNASAIGNPSVKLAIIDTGVDQTHPELMGSKIVHTGCFITNPSGVQSTGTFTDDEDGHGTDVAGIAVADTNNGIGFSGTGGNVSLMAYRVFPTPDDNCANDNSDDDQCSAQTPDIAAAITDAVNNGANVISISLGGSTCSGTADGGDSDPMEGAAIENAVTAGVVVVAASGNSGGTGVAAPACDTGVIAAGASALDDGMTNGSSHTVGTAAAPVEYVASYTQVGTPAQSLHSASAWGIVAPGGDPTDDNDEDDLHWIENIWTSTPFMSSPTDTAFEGSCTNDYPNGSASNAPDCRTLIAGTSMSTPHVAGAAALILSVNAAYKGGTAMKTLLCQTADDIGDAREGCGRLNVYRAMAVALGDTNPP